MKRMVPAWLLCIVAAAAAADWRPAAISDQSTIEILTVVPPEGEHWSTVWFTVIDGTAYVRLGSRARKRIEASTMAPRTKVRTADGVVHAMRYEQAPELADKIASAMYEKYWSDVLGEPFRKLGLTAPPLMLRLLPANESSGP